jgi:hypothetical protein
MVTFPVSVTDRVAAAMLPDTAPDSALFKDTVPLWPWNPLIETCPGQRRATTAAGYLDWTVAG